MITPTISKKRKILIVDDEPAISELLTMILEARGFDVVTAATGFEGFKKADSSFDLILLDLILPDLDGLEICHRLKSEASTRNIPIMILSAKNSSREKMDGFNMGADDYVLKPFEQEELVHRIQGFFERKSVVSRESAARTVVFQELKNILNQEQIISFFQPIYYLKPLSLLGVEMLTRPKKPGVLANAEQMFTAAIDFGLYVDLELISWKKAFQTFKNEMRTQPLFLNCHPALIKDSQLETVKHLFERANIDFENVYLEISDRSEIESLDAFSRQLKAYRNLGFHIVVDDVQGGFDSLESIVETHPEIVKIDRKIVEGICSDDYKRSMVKFLVQFCKENRIMTIAEGIEGPDELEVLADLGVDAGQGYYLYRPTPDFHPRSMQQPILVK